jgi:hypothetical protein
MLNRSETAIIIRAGRIGSLIRKHRAWTADEDEFLRSNVDKMTRYQMAAALDRQSVGYRILKLGLQDPRNYISDEERESIRQLNSQGLNDTEIGRRLGRHRALISNVRARLGIATNCDRIEQLKAARANRLNGDSLRNEEVRQFARESGWPEDLPLVCIEILNLLATIGPMNSKQLAEHLDIKPTKYGRRHNGQSRIIAVISFATKSKNGYRSNGAIAYLKNRDLIFEIGKMKRQETGRRGGAGHHAVYVLTAQAVRMQEKRHAAS